MKAVIQKYWDILSYLFFGGLTTVVDFLVFWPCFNLLHWSATVSNLVAWICAVAFAYLTNKPFVFKSHDWSGKVVIPELTKFVACRIGSFVIQTLCLLVTVDLLHWDGNWMKIITSVLVIIINYVGSKLLVFTKK
ncbi:MAG: GtrA family protein [Ruminococcaceae bacterium]|nr:GtrA family protein [Oscillospiraceae bacterium]